MASPSDLDPLLRRAVMTAARDVFDLQKLIDGAELALAIDRPGEARLLYTLSFLAAGFSADAMARQQAIADRTGLWDDLAEADIRLTARRSFAVDIALDELRDIIAIETGPLPTGAIAASPHEGNQAVPSGLRDLLARMLQAFRTSAPDGIEALEALLGGLGEQLLSAPIVDLRDYVDAEPDRLADLLAVRFLQFFLRTHYLLAFAPLGSARLLHAAARLDPVGLGAYFSNVPRLLRHSHDIAGMVRTVTRDRAKDVSADLIDGRTILLASGADPYLRAELVDSFADAGKTLPIWALLRGSAMRLPLVYERDLLIRIRDAGLDCNDLALAAEAQELIVERSNAINEWIVLGDIRATRGERAGAEEAYGRCLGGSVVDPRLAARMEALRSEDFAALALIGGMHTPSARQRARLARWGAVPMRLRGTLQPAGA